MVTNFAPGTGAPASLHAQCSGAGDRDVLLLHGLFGAGSNLGVIARALASRYRVHQLDLPGHGRSPWIEPMSLATLAQSLRDYQQTAVRRSVVMLGHSLGGKVAMEFALQWPGDVAALVVADIAPVVYPASHDAVFAAIAAVQAASPRSRREAAALLRRHLREEAVVQFLSLSLARDGSGAWNWRFDADGLRRDYPALLDAPPAGLRYAGPSLFVYGEHSRYVDAQGRYAAQQRFPGAAFVAIPNAGHWLHVEQPEAVNTAVLRFLATALDAQPGVTGP